MIHSSTHSTTKVLMVTCIYPHYSAPHEGTFVANWAEQLKAVGLDIRVYKRDHLTFGSYLSSFQRVCRFYKSPRIYQYDWHGISVFRQGIHLRFPLNYSKTAPKLTYKKMKPEIQKIYTLFPFDLIYLATWGDLSLAMSRIAREMKIPYIASAIGEHDNNYYDKPGSLYFKYHREIFLGSKFVICVSDDLNKKVKIMTEGKANTLTYYSGVDSTKFRPSSKMRSQFRELLGYTEENIVILIVCRLEKAKGIYELVEAFAQLSRNSSSLRLLLVGPIIEKSELRRQIKRYNISGKVTLTGGVAHEDIPGYMNASDIFVLPSWMEGVPNVVMEACACEMPVIASAVGGIPEVIQNETTGFLVPPKSPEALARQLHRLLIDPELAKSAAKNARQRALEKFNYHENGELLLSELQSVFTQLK